MKRRMALFPLLSRLRKDEHGTVFVQFTVYLLAIMGMMGLALDGGRFILLHNSLRDMADAAALAGAKELDGKPPGNGVLGARDRATAAAQAMANNNPPRWFNTGGSASIGTPVYYSAISPGGDTVATGDDDAWYIKVTTSASGIVPTFLVAVGAHSQTTQTTATAQSNYQYCAPVD